MTPKKPKDCRAPNPNIPNSLESWDAAIKATAPTAPWSTTASDRRWSTPESLALVADGHTASCNAMIQDLGEKDQAEADLTVRRYINSQALPASAMAAEWDSSGQRFFARPPSPTAIEDFEEQWNVMIEKAKLVPPLLLPAFSEGPKDGRCSLVESQVGLVVNGHTAACNERLRGLADAVQRIAARRIVADYVKAQHLPPDCLAAEWDPAQRRFFVCPPGLVEAMSKFVEKWNPIEHRAVLAQTIREKLDDNTE